MTTKNENCLAGMKCPVCGSYGPFRIEATTLATVHDNGVDETVDFEWSSDSYCECGECEYSCIVEDFR